MSDIEIKISKDPKDCAGPPKLEVKAPDIRLEDLAKLIDYAKRMGWI
jgi:hypothetical protein